MGLPEGVLRELTPPTPGTPPEAPLLGNIEGDLLSNLGVKGGGLLMGLKPWYPGVGTPPVETGVGVESQNLRCLLNEVTVEKACPHL